MRTWLFLASWTIRGISPLASNFSSSSAAASIVGLFSGRVGQMSIKGSRRGIVRARERRRAYARRLGRSLTLPCGAALSVSRVAFEDAEQQGQGGDQQGEADG